MKVLVVHNEYARFSGEEAACYALVGALERRGISVRLFVRRSGDIPDTIRGAVGAFASGLWSRRAAREMREALASFRPDIVHLQNIYPLISASVVPVIADSQAALVMACHNYRLFCPTGLMLRQGQPCTKCAVGREYHCVLNNCMHHIPRSVGYALRNRIARPLLLHNVHQFVVLSKFQAGLFAKWGIPAARLSVVPNFVTVASATDISNTEDSGRYVGFLGRVSPEKGIDVLVRAARLLPDIPIRVAGHAAAMEAVAESAPANMTFVGELGREQAGRFWEQARFGVMPSICFESFGLAAVEAMLAGRPVIASEIGGLIDIVDAGETGLFVRPGDPNDLATKIRFLWEEQETCTAMGNAARKRIAERFGEEAVFRALMGGYHRAISQKEAEQCQSSGS